MPLVRSSRVVLAPRPWRQVCGKYPLMTVAKKAAHRGEHEVRRKAVAWGMSECSPLNLYASVPFLCARAHETAGAARTPAPPRPLFRETGATNLQSSGENMPRE